MPPYEHSRSSRWHLPHAGLARSHFTRRLLQCQHDPSTTRARRAVVGILLRRSRDRCLPLPTRRHCDTAYLRSLPLRAFAGKHRMEGIRRLHDASGSWPWQKVKGSLLGFRVEVQPLPLPLCLGILGRVVALVLAMLAQMTLRLCRRRTVCSHVSADDMRCNS